MSVTCLPGETTSLTARIRQWAIIKPNDLAFVFLADGENETGHISFGELDDKARRLGGRMMRAGLSGQPVLLPAQNGPGFILGLCGCLYAGAIAVPIPIQVRNRGKERIRSIVRDAGIVAVLGTDPSAALHLTELIPGISSLSIDDLEDEPAFVAACDPQRLSASSFGIST